MPTKNTNFGTAGDYYPFLFIGILNIRISNWASAHPLPQRDARICAGGFGKDADFSYFCTRAFRPSRFLRIAAGAVKTEGRLKTIRK